MKVKYDNYKGGTDFDSVKEAVTDALTPNAYSYDGTLEGMGARIEKLQEMLACLIENLYGEAQFRAKPDQLRDMLGYGYEVEE